MTRASNRIAVHVAAGAGALLTLAPLAWMVSASMMAPGEASLQPPPVLPAHPTLEHYAALLTRMNLARSFLNSAAITVLATVLSVLINAAAGYALAKLAFPGRERLFRIIASVLVVPAQVGMLPLFLLIRELGLVNTYAAVLIPYLASVFGMFLVRQYALGIPDDLLDAARVDGAGEARIFFLIVLPTIRPVLAALATFTFLTAWNDFLWPLIVLTDSSMYTLPVALANLAGEHVQDTELMMAGAVLTVLPVIIVFLFFQRALERGILAGSVRG
jgi:multiple sugar transport system permease protein